MKNTLTIFILFLFLPNLKAQSLYETSSITLIELEFAESNWDEIMDANYASGTDDRLIGACTVNGLSFDQVGVKFKGNSTYSASNLKNPLNIELNTIIDQTFQGYTTFKLSSGSKDPSFIREVLSYEIGRKYMDMPLANFAKVIINGEYYGMFTSVESIDGDYQERRIFCDDDNTRFKCNPEEVMVGASSLEYLGSDSSDYFTSYELKSDYGWNELVDFTYGLNFDFAAIESYLDVDRAIWMLAFNNVLVNLDSYTGPFQQNYYLIKDDNDRFLPIIWDLNQSLGSFSMIGGGGPGPSDIIDLIEMDLFLRADDSSFPLIQKILANDSYLKMYVAHAKTILEENFSDGSYYDRAEELQAVIAAEIAAEPNGFYSVSQFTANLNSSVGGGPGPGGGSVVGISELMDDRVAFLEGLTEWSYIAPTISTVTNTPTNPISYSTVNVTALVSNADVVYMAYRNDLQDAFEKVEMYDDGLHGDGGAGDLVYGTSIALSAKDIQFYVYAENAEVGKFSPVRAAHEYYSIAIGGDVVINELMPDNKVTVTDEEGKYEDWIELYNRTDLAIDLSGYYLSDRPNANPLMWEIPEGTLIPANGYLTIWLDEDTLDDGLHANFKLSASGESVSFSDPDGFEINRVKMPEMSSSTTYGRYPNGTGPFIRMFPTFGASNSYTSLSIEDEIEVAEMTLYPNPASDYITITNSSAQSQAFQVYDLQGKLIFESQISGQYQLDLQDFNSGFYLVVLPATGQVNKFVVNK
ncbi:CotH kinase family protein [Crocinitomix sp.]|nr:CotH kinase family protein [Crocinitomix sp.]